MWDWGSWELWERGRKRSRDKKNSARRTEKTPPRPSRENQTYSLGSGRPGRKTATAAGSVRPPGWEVFPGGPKPPVWPSGFRQWRCEQTQADCWLMTQWTSELPEFLSAQDGISNARQVWKSHCGFQDGAPVNTWFIPEVNAEWQEGQGTRWPHGWHRPSWDMALFKVLLVHTADFLQNKA